MGKPPATGSSTKPSPHLAAVVAALGDVQQALTRPGFDLAEVLEIVLDRAVRLCHADSADVVLPDGDVYRPAASVGFSGGFWRENLERSFAPGRGSVIGRALLEGRTVHVPDVLADPEYAIGVGYATLGRIGFEGRYDYGAIGNVVITSSRLSDAAQAGQILISQRVFAAVEAAVDAEPIPDLVLKGLSRPVTAFNVRGLR